MKKQLVILSAVVVGVALIRGGGTDNDTLSPSDGLVESGDSHSLYLRKRVARNQGREDDLRARLSRNFWEAEDGGLDLVTGAPTHPVAKDVYTRLLSESKFYAKSRANGGPNFGIKRRGEPLEEKRSVLDEVNEANAAGDCDWCDQVYDAVGNSLRKERLSRDEISFRARALALSGTAKNVSTLMSLASDAPPSDTTLFTQQIKNSPLDAEAVDLVSEILETQDLEDSSPEEGDLQENRLLTEAMVSALTREGSLQAAQALYDHTVAHGDPDGYYIIGIGLGEMTPNPDAVPYLQDIARAGDEYSHLAVKALLNTGMEGAEFVFELLEESPPEVAKELLKKGAVDHVGRESDGVDGSFLVSKRNSSNPAVSEFAKHVLKERRIDIPGIDREIIVNENAGQEVATETIG